MFLGMIDAEDVGIGNDLFGNAVHTDVVRKEVVEHNFKELGE